MSRTCVVLALLCATAGMAATSGFLLGVDYSEWAPAGATRIATDSSGALYILAPCSDSSAFSCVTKLSADGKTVLWQNSLDFQANAMAVDPNGGVYLVPGYPRLYFSVVKLDASGSGIAWQTPSGMLSPGPGLGPALAADAQGRAYVAGVSCDGDVVRLNSAGNGVEYATLVRGKVVSIAVDGSGAALVTGFAVACQGGDTEGFLARLAPDGSAGFYSALAQVYPRSVVLDSNGNAVVFGDDAANSGVVQRFDSTGAVTSSRSVSRGNAFALDAAGNAYITISSDQLFPVRNSLFMCGSELLSVYAPDGSVLQTTYLPGSRVRFNFPISPPLVAAGPHSTIFVEGSADATFAPSQGGPFSVASVADFLVRLSPDANAQTEPLACLGNAATYNPGPIAPGGLITLFGNGLGPQQGIQTQATQQSPFPTQVSNMEVTFDGKPAPLLWVQEHQINVVVPWSLTPGKTTQVCVSNNGAKLNCLTWPVAETDPAVFTVDGAYAAALNQDGTVNSAANPAKVGSVVSVFATGMGPISPPQADGSLVGLPLPVNEMPVGVAYNSGCIRPPDCTFANLTVDYQGPAPFELAGLTQINFHVPDQIPSLPLFGAGGIWVGGSNQFWIYVTGP